MGADISAGAIVVGAGVMGCAIALELQRAGIDTVVVDSRGGPGLGSTSASSAIIRYQYRNFPETALAWESGARWKEWGRYLGVDDPAGMARLIYSGALVLEGPGYDVDLMVGHMRQLGIEVDEISGAQIAERFPGIDPTHFGPPTLPEDDRFWADGEGELRAFHVKDCGHMDDPQLAAHNLAHAAEVNGARFLYRAEVVEVLRDDTRVLGVRLADGRELAAPRVINAAGPWSAELNRLADVLGDFETSTRPMEQEVISVPAPANFTLENGVCVTDADFATYFRPHAGNTIIVGGMEPDCDPLVWLDSPEDAIEKVSQATWELQSLRLARRVPDVTPPGRPSGIVGIYDVTEDWIPIYDRTMLDGFYVAIGTSGHGFKQAPYVGELITTLIQRIEAGHDHDAEPLVLTGSWTGAPIDLAHFSRRRDVIPQHGMG